MTQQQTARDGDGRRGKRNGGCCVLRRHRVLSPPPHCWGMDRSMANAPASRRRGVLLVGHGAAALQSPWLQAAVAWISAYPGGNGRSTGWPTHCRCRRCHCHRPLTLPALCSPRPPMVQGSTARRDLLLSLQNAAQSKWESAKAFDIDAPAQGSGTPAEKFFGTFPYPYMNGVLHLGHAFSLSKLEFASAYHRLCGKNVLFAQGFHCTGMPIKVRQAHIRSSGSPARLLHAVCQPCCMSVSWTAAAYPVA